MNTIDRTDSAPAVRVSWSAGEAAYVARSDRFPGLTARNEWSALAALDEFIELVEHVRRQGDGVRPAA
ncbi:hypothetical protein [Nocardia sp. NPDC057668]|uniref:hypothetical protein n=1 Tax=Nocardia sp. NPDC057668 TaxID=3346202 RepID=UPI00366F8C5B